MFGSNPSGGGGGGGAVAWGAITGTLSDQTDLQAALNAKVTGTGTSSGANTGDQTNISGNAGTVTTNANLTGPVTSAGNATAIANGAITNAMLVNGAVANLSGINTGDNATNTLYSGLVTNATHTGDATGATALTLATVNGNTGSFGSAGYIPVYEINAKGLTISSTSVGIMGRQFANVMRVTQL